jgi:hypothetical protein
MLRNPPFTWGRTLVGGLLQCPVIAHEGGEPTGPFAWFEGITLGPHKFNRLSAHGVGRLKPRPWPRCSGRHGVMDGAGANTSQLVGWLSRATRQVVAPKGVSISTLCQSTRDFHHTQQQRTRRDAVRRATQRHPVRESHSVTFSFCPTPPSNVDDLSGFYVWIQTLVSMRLLGCAQLSG